MSHDCHFDIDRDASTSYWRFSSDDSVDLLSRTTCTTVVVIETGQYPLWDEVKFNDRDPHWYSRRVLESIRTGLHPNNINSYRDGGIEIPEAWMPIIRQHNS